MIIRQHWYWNSRELIKYAEGLWPWGTLPQLHNIRSRSWQRYIIIWCQETRGSVPSCSVPQCWYTYAVSIQPILLTKLPLVKGFVDNCSKIQFLDYSALITVLMSKLKKTLAAADNWTLPCVLPENWPSSSDIAPLCRTCHLLLAWAYCDMWIGNAGVNLFSIPHTYNKSQCKVSPSAAVFNFVKVRPFSASGLASSWIVLCISLLLDCVQIVAVLLLWKNWDVK